ncbi:MAG: hypothetical protein E2O39_10020, partial [Planctomycetota bacterium]
MGLRAGARGDPRPGVLRIDTGRCADEPDRHPPDRQAQPGDHLCKGRGAPGRPHDPGTRRVRAPTARASRVPHGPAWQGPAPGRPVRPGRARRHPLPVPVAGVARAPARGHRRRAGDRHGAGGDRSRAGEDRGGAAQARVGTGAYRGPRASRLQAGGPRIGGGRVGGWLAPVGCGAPARRDPPGQRAANPTARDAPRCDGRGAAPGSARGARCHWRGARAGLPDDRLDRRARGRARSRRGAGRHRRCVRRAAGGGALDGRSHAASLSGAGAPGRPARAHGRCPCAHCSAPVARVPDRGRGGGRDDDRPGIAPHGAHDHTPRHAGGARALDPSGVLGVPRSRDRVHGGSGARHSPLRHRAGRPDARLLPARPQGSEHGDPGRGGHGRERRPLGRPAQRRHARRRGGPRRGLRAEARHAAAYLRTAGGARPRRRQLPCRSLARTSRTQENHSVLRHVIRFSIDHAALVLILAGVLLAVAAYRLQRTPVDVFPELNAPTVVVMTEAPGLAADEVEQYVTFLVEAAVNGIPGV